MSGDEREIRPFRAADHAAVVALWSEVFRDDPPWNAPSEMIRRKAGVQPELFLVARDRDRVIGTVVAGFDGVRGWIHHLAVHPSARRRGVATRLVRTAEAGLAKLGCPKVNLQVRATNAAVIAFYRRLGYGVEERVSMGRRLEEETRVESRTRVASEHRIEWQAESSPDGSARRFRKKLGATAGGRALGCSLYRIPPGAKPWPRHYHCANEEALYVLSGEGTLALGDRSVPLRAGDYVALPAGAAHAHGVANDSQEDLVFLCVSTMVHPDVVVYPDSAKVGIFAGTAPGGPPDESTLKAFLPLSAAVDYWKDE